MISKFKVGDHVTWNSEAGHVSGTIIKVHRRDVDYKGHTHHATKDAPQYEIKSDKTDHIAMHKGTALKNKNDSRGARRHGELGHQTGCGAAASRARNSQNEC
jgi:hypothetical protein